MCNWRITKTKKQQKQQKQPTACRKLVTFMSAVLVGVCLAASEILSTLAWNTCARVHNVTHIPTNAVAIVAGF